LSLPLLPHFGGGCEWFPVGDALPHVYKCTARNHSRQRKSKQELHAIQILLFHIFKEFIGVEMSLLLKKEIEEKKLISFMKKF